MPDDEHDTEREEGPDGAELVAREDGEAEQRDSRDEDRARDERPALSFAEDDLQHAEAPRSARGRRIRPVGVSSCRRRLLRGFRLELADARAKVLENEREPDRGEEHGQEDDDRRRLLASRRDRRALRGRHDLRDDALLRRNAVRVLLADDVLGEGLAAGVREIDRGSGRRREARMSMYGIRLSESRIDDGVSLDQPGGVRPPASRAWNSSLCTNGA